VVGFVRRRQHLGLVDEVDPEGLQDLRLDQVADAALGHHGDRDGVHDALDHVGVRHARHAALHADVGWHALEGHHRGRARVLGDAGVVGRDDVHDDAAFEHLGEPVLDAAAAGRRFAHRSTILTRGAAPRTAPVECPSSCSHAVGVRDSPRMTP